jgi:hypothetical protein
MTLYQKNKIKMTIFLDLIFFAKQLLWEGGVDTQGSGDILSYSF